MQLFSKELEMKRRNPLKPYPITLAMLFFIALTPLSLHAQPEIEWSHLYGVDETVRHYCWNVAKTPDNHILMVGRAQNFPEDILYRLSTFVLKTDINGEEIWSRAYREGLNDETAYCILPSSDNEYIIGGFVESNIDEHDVERQFIYSLATCIDEDGGVIWRKQYQLEQCSKIYSLVEANDGGYYITGMVYSVESGRDGYLLRTNSEGDSLWSRYFGEGGNEFFNKVILLDDGNLVLIGATAYSFGTGRSSFYIVKVNAMGEEIWSRVIETESSETTINAIQTSDGGFAVVGWTGLSPRYPRILKINENGEVEWMHIYGDDQHHIQTFHSILETEDQGFVAIGYQHSPSVETGYLVRTDRNGNALWSQTYQLGDLSSTCTGINHSEDNGYLISGFARFERGVFDRFWLFKTDPDPVGVPILVNPAIPDQNILSPCYPNPFNAITNISFDMAGKGHVQLGIFDMIGRKVSDLIDTDMESGQYNFSWDAAGLASGAYQCRMRVGEQVITQKLIFTK